MYRSFFGMENTPFVRNVPSGQLYESSAIHETLARLEYVARNQLFAVVTADSGCGKSTLIRRFYEELPKEEYIILYLSDSKLTPRWFYKGMQEFRFLLNYQFDSVSPMALILVGQSELWDTKLKLQRYAAIRQRIDVYCVLPHLDRAETEQYIASHLKYAGCTQEIFTSKAIDIIYKVSTGIPRMINRVCEKALMYSCQQHKKLIDDHMIQFVVDHEMLSI